MKYFRLARVMRRLWKSKTIFSIHRDILLYQKARNRSAEERKLGYPGTDWEGEQALFHKYIRMAIRYSRKTVSDIVVKKAA